MYPSHVEVIAPVPPDAGAAPTAAVLTLTSCHPKFSATQRFVVHATLVESVPRAEWDPARLTTASAAESSGGNTRTDQSFALRVASSRLPEGLG
ncbi:MAG TPA: sortase [Ornithinibacter sp.]|nr:sortase [Ornithinibacter sp.]